MLISLLVVASVITLVITIIIMKKLAKREKKSTDICQNRELHPESTVGDSLPLHKYVEILSDACTLINIFCLFIFVCCMYVCTCKCIIMYLYKYALIVIHFK